MTEALHTSLHVWLAYWLPLHYQTHSCNVILGSELDLADVEMLGPAVVYDATPNTATVDEDPVGVPLGSSSPKTLLASSTVLIPL